MVRRHLGRTEAVGGPAIDPRYVATRALFERCRARVDADDVRSFAPSDPGYPGYVAAFEKILARGEAALPREYDFDVAETIALTRWCHASVASDPVRFRWFRLFTNAVDVLIERSETPHYTLAALLIDTFALDGLGDPLAPKDLLADICREIDVAQNGALATRERVFCVLGELVLASSERRGDDAIDAACAELERRDERHRSWWEAEGDTWIERPASDEFVWGVTHHDLLHPVWLDLVDTCFPTSTAVSAATKARLLADGARWRAPTRVMS